MEKGRCRSSRGSQCLRTQNLGRLLHVHTLKHKAPDPQRQLGETIRTLTRIKGINAHTPLRTQNWIKMN